MIAHHTSSSRRMRSRKHAMYVRIDRMSRVYDECVIVALIDDVVNAHDLHDIASCDNVIASYERHARIAMIRDDYYASFNVA